MFLLKYLLCANLICPQRLHFLYLPFALCK
nr:MAG TPA: hypothetical protein [Caudoviricetes sp.]